MSNETKFEVGDIVMAFGNKGVVTKISCNHVGYVLVDFAIGYLVCFFPDGKTMPWHAEPSLKLIKRPKNKVKKYKVLFKRHDEFIVSKGDYASEAEFTKATAPIRKFIQLIKESEIEVEEK